MTPNVKKMLIGGGVLIIVAAVLNFVVFAEKTTPQTNRGAPGAAP
ncbi:MAG: hypothetical protein Q8Q09_29240 [Deltaproteobacteria bacterium]|nr:hypothetical protein [Deltaproteobacteria bacterium]